MSASPDSIFPLALHFAHPWRKYQEKILAETDLMLSQGKLHVVAPPGSGKTILGLELMLRSGRKTLILAPTLVIREQWIERLVQDFGAEANPDWISRDLQQTASLTVCTYQALHQAWKSNPQIIAQIQENQIGTLIVDECHHLQKEWWKPLIALKKELNPLLIALTATPPYDVSNFEWARYYELCGEIDEIIYTPELVAAGDLCPHQDYLYLSLPQEQKALEIQDFHQSVEAFIERLQYNYGFIELLKQHPWLHQPEAHLEAIYENPSYFSALMIGLEGLGKVAPWTALGIIGADESQIPKLNLYWLEVLLQNALLNDPYFQPYLQEEALEGLEKQLRRMGALAKNKVCLRESPKLGKQLRHNSSKLQAITAITKIESEHLGADLRMVILCDYIHKSLLPDHELDDPAQDQLGVVPVFESLRRAFPLGLEIGVLSGSLVIVPQVSINLLRQLLGRWQMQDSEFRFSALKHDNLYAQVEAVSARAKANLVPLITALFAQGGIHALIGTTALLGEGWDAPEINTLVLATSVGSHVLSNQMRGRAIRVHRQLKEKTANIWHLACVDSLAIEGGSDVLMLKRRMMTFFGLDQNAQPLICTGIDRFALPEFPLTTAELDQFNYNMAVYARARPRLQRVWQEAIAQGYTVQEKIRIPHVHNSTYTGKKTLIIEQATQAYQKDFRRFGIFSSIWLPIALILVGLGNAVGWNWGSLVFGLSTAILLLAALDFFQLRRLRWVPAIIRYFNTLVAYRPYLSLRLILHIAVLIWVIWAWGLLPGLIFLSFILVAWLAYLSIFNTTFILGAWPKLRRIKDPHLFFRGIAESLFDALFPIKGFDGQKTFQLELNTDSAGHFEVLPKNLDTQHAQLYLNALQELLNPIENPRYLVAMKYDLDHKEPVTYYFPIPACVGKKKKDAEQFTEIWEEKLGPSRLVYTRTSDGRLELLKARGQSLGIDPEGYASRLSSWE